MSQDNKFGYALIRGGKVVATERTLACAQHWVDAEIIPLCPVQQRDDLLTAMDSILAELNEGLNCSLTNIRKIAQSSIDSVTPAIIFYPAGSLGEEIVP